MPPSKTRDSRFSTNRLPYHLPFHVPARKGFVLDRTRLTFFFGNKEKPLVPHVIPDPTMSGVLVQGPVQKTHIQPGVIVVLPHFSRWLGFHGPRIDYFGERIVSRAKILKAIDVPPCQNKWEQNFPILWSLETRSHLLFLSLSKCAFGFKESLRKMCDGLHGTPNLFRDERGHLERTLRMKPATYLGQVVHFHLPKHLDAVRSWLGIDDFVVLRADH